MKHNCERADQPHGSKIQSVAGMAAMVACLSLIVAPAFGQIEEETITLSPFVVDASQDVGYRATNTTSGTSLNTPIKDIPMAIEVINQDFIDDTGATNFDEALEYSAGVYLDDFVAGDGVSEDGSNTAGANTVDSADRSPSSRGGVGGRFDNVTIIRGFNVPFQNRDGFRYGGLIAQYGTVLGGIIDTSNVERLEVVRGPNSLLYGIGVLSGIVNVIPKRPLSANVQSYSLGVGSDGYLRGTWDITGPLSENFLGGQLNYRIAGVYEERDHWTDFRSKGLEYYVGQLQYTSEKWNVFLEGQYADQIEEGIGDQTLYDNVNAGLDLNFRNEFGEQFNWTRDYGGLPGTYRITGPDTYHFRREDNIMANVDFTPIENLTISAGMFLTDAREEEFDVNLSTVVNEERNLDIKGVLRLRPLDANTENPQQIIDFLDENVVEFPVDYLASEGDRRNLTDYRTTRYWWDKEPEYTTSDQYRVRAAYNFESNFFGESRAKHTFLVGRHDIKDVADFTNGAERINLSFADKGELATDDPLQMRNIFDHSVIRYNGEPLAQPGREYRNAQIWFTGHYALYQGQFLNDKLGVIVGARHDRYHSRDRLYDRFDELAAFGPDYDGPPVSGTGGNDVAVNPDNTTYGFFPLPDGVSEYIPNPTEAEKEVTKTFAVNYKIRDDLTVYALQSEGLTPNTGARDGNLEGLPSEQSSSSEIGIKFDLLKGKVSGTLSLYKIERENALWQFDAAPAPAKWLGGIRHPTDEAGAATGFNPEWIASGFAKLNYGVDRYYFDQDGVELGQVFKLILDDEGTPIGREIAFPDGLLGIQGHASGSTNPRSIAYLEYEKLDLPVIDADGNENGKTWRHYIEKAFADKGRSASEFNTALGPDDFDPIHWERSATTLLGVNPSIGNATGANVTYTDEATGYDFQLILSPTDNWQILLNYAHTEREATSSFNMVDVVDPESGVVLGTEYDIWVRTFGREAYGLVETDTDGDGVVDTVTRDGQTLAMGDVSPLDLTGGLQGVSLYTGSEDSAAMWSKYSFTEGRFKNLDASLGVTYRGPAETSIPIGGVDLAANQFRTPATEERINLNASFKYKWSRSDVDYQLKLNLYNLTDDQKGLTTASYLDDGTPLQRRTVVYYTPRSYRLSFSVLF